MVFRVVVLASLVFSQMALVSSAAYCPPNVCSSFINVIYNKCLYVNDARTLCQCDDSIKNVNPLCTSVSQTTRVATSTRPPSTTIQLTTRAPTTAPPTTKAPTTAPPTTRVPTTAPPTIKAPTTAPPTTRAQTTAPPTTKAPTTAPPTTKTPTTAPPTTKAPTTAPPTTKTPTTAPPTTRAPTTAPPTTKAPTTTPPTTKTPTTAPPTTKAPTTAPPTTKAPTTTVSPSGCPSPYAALTPTHTMCKTDKGVNIPLSQAAKDAIVEKHHEYRRTLTGEPLAANMQKLYWDEDLATVAAKHSRQCYVGHDTYDERAEPKLPGVTIGQNAAGGYPDVPAAVVGWASEKKDFQYAVDHPGTVTGHYTQVIFADTVRVGCGMADCSMVAGAYPKVQICNYAIGQNGNLVRTQPYVKSTTASCSACASKCDASGKLCDCGGKVCFNGGTLNPATCACTCPEGWTGDNCQTKNCPGQDTTKCPLYKGYPNPCQYNNVKYTECPYFCGFCP